MIDNPLPELWTQVKLEDVAQLIGGGTPSRSNKQYFEGNIPWVTPTDVTALNSLYIDKTTEYITEDGLRNSSVRLLPVGTVLMTSRATIGSTAIAQKEMCTNQGFANFICNEKLIFNEYLAYWLPAVKTWLYQIAGGTTFKEISRSTLAKVQIPLPPLPEQQRIVAILRQADDLRRQQQAALQEAQKLIPAIFHKMFGEDLAKQGGWPTKRIGDIGEVSYGLTVNQRRRSVSEQKPYLRVANVQRWRLDLSDMTEIGVLGGDQEKYTLNAGDILVVEGHANPDEIGRAAVWNNEVPGCLHQNHILRIRITTGILTPNYIAGYINSLRGRTYMLRYGKTSSGLNTINSTVLSDMPIVCPPIELQVKFEQVYEDSKQLIAEHARKKESLDQLFGSFLVNAFTGDLTIKFRDTHQELLATAAVERDTQILSSTPSRHSQETTELSHVQQPRSSVVRCLGIGETSQDFGQLELLTLMQNSEAQYFTADTIQQIQQNLPLNFIKQCLELFEKVGLIDCISLWVDPTGTIGNSQGYYQDFYRLPQPQSQLMETAA